MHIPSPSVVRGLIAGALFLLASAIGAVPAAAATVTYQVADQAVVRFRGVQANVTIRTWDRDVVQVDWNDGDPVSAFKGPFNWNRTAIPIPAQPNMKEPDGSIASFAPEDFPVPQLAQGLHDEVEVNEGQLSTDIARPLTDLSHVTITIPASTRALFIGVRRGDVQLSNYNGTSITFAGGARVLYTNVGGDAFVQSMANHVYLIRSNFNRLRLRSNRADELFEGCHIQQVDATSIGGNIVFDDGFFDPGLAHFESEHGNVAIGLAGPAQLAMHSQDGHIFTMIGRGIASTPQAGNDVSLAYAGGGPVVNATSIHGNVFAYDGSIFTHPVRLLSPEWRPVVASLYRRRQALPANFAFPRSSVRPSPERIQAPLDRHPHDLLK